MLILLLCVFSLIFIEAEHGYASSLPMPIEDHGSSPTPSSSSSSTRPIKIKKNQGSRSVVFYLIVFDPFILDMDTLTQFFSVPFFCLVRTNRSTHNELEKNR